MELIKKPNEIIRIAQMAIGTTASKFFKNGVEIEKGAIFTQNRIDKSRNIFEKYFWKWSIYPDLFEKGA